MTPFDPKWPQIKFDTASVFIISNNIIPEVFMTQAYMSHRKGIFKPKSKIWPHMTPGFQILSKLLFHPRLKFTELIDGKQNKFWQQGTPANRPPIWVFQLKKQHFLINSRIQKFFFIIIFGGQIVDTTTLKFDPPIRSENVSRP